MDKILIMAGNFRQAKEYANLNKLNPSEWKYVSKYSDIVGYKDCSLITIENWTSGYHNKEDRANLWTYCETHNIK